MSRLIDADALLEAICAEDVLKVHQCIKLVRQAPTIESEASSRADSGEAVAWRYKLKINSEWLYITKYPTGCEDSCPVIVEPLYTTPQQPQSVADALLVKNILRHLEEVLALEACR